MTLLQFISTIVILKNKSMKITQKLQQNENSINKKSPKRVQKKKKSLTRPKVVKPQEAQYRNAQGVYDEQHEDYDAHHNAQIQYQENKKSPSAAQYAQLIQKSGKGFKRQKNLFFIENEKYKGKKNNQAESQDAEEFRNFNQQAGQSEFSENKDNVLNKQDSSFDDFQQEDKNYQQDNINKQQYEEQNQGSNNEIKKALNLLQQKRLNTSKYINSQLQQINAEDQTHLKAIIKNKPKLSQEEYIGASQLKKLLEIYDRFVQLRYGQQNELQQIKKYPKMDQQKEDPKYPPFSHDLHSSSKQLQNLLITNLSKLYSLYKNLAKKSLMGSLTEQNLNNHKSIQNQVTSIDLETMIINQKNQSIPLQNNSSERRLNVDKIYNIIKHSIQQQTHQAQKQLIKWSQKASFLTSTKSNQLNSLLMQTPVGQAKKVLQNWQRLALKCQQKRGIEMFKILFQPQQNIHELSDPQIFDDYDLFIELEKYYLEKLENDHEDGEFLQSATMKYLKNKQSHQLEHQKKQQNVDRKASKNRKIRFNVHTKLLNFMPSCPQSLIQTRDEIVKNIFNCNAQVNKDSMEGNINRYRMAQPHDQTDLIQVE